MNRVYFIFLTLCVFSTASAQEKLIAADAEQITTMKSRITAASAAIHSMSCDFEQVKTVSLLADEARSTGCMSYRQPDKLHWEYRQPYHYLFTVDGTKVTIETGEGRREIDARQSKLFKTVTSMIMAGINGTDIFDDKRFDMQYFLSPTAYAIVVTPRKKAVKQMFYEVRLLFDANDCTVEQVDITEAGGDRTLIHMLNKKINK